LSVRDLPARPNLDQYKKQAKELLKAILSGERDALDRLRRAHPRANASRFDATRVTLADAQLVIAREHGIESWKKFTERADAWSMRVLPTAAAKALRSSPDAAQHSIWRPPAASDVSIS
jgi:hypothetical protein